MSDRTRHSPFVSRVLSAVDEKYQGWGNRPSPRNWTALSAIATTIETMASGSAERVTYLSSAPTGLGKSVTIRASIVELMRDDRYRECGIVVFLRQREQVRYFHEKLTAAGIPASDISVQIGNKSEKDDLHTLVGVAPNEARIVIATQAKLLSVVAKRRDVHASASLDELWLYRDAPRRVRVWDESIIPAKPFVLLNGDIENAVKQLRDAKLKTAADLIETWRRGLRAGASTVVPWFDKPEYMLHTRLLAKGGAFDDGSPLETLLEQQEQGLAVRADHKGNAVLHYAEVLPDDFAPFLITDASGELRGLYPYWDRGRGKIVHLESGEKRYEGLTIHHWDHKSGTGTHFNNAVRLTLAQAAASVFSRVPANDEVLFIVRKPSKPFQNMERLEEDKPGKTGKKDGEKTPGIRDLLTPEQNARAYFLTWGRHEATNDYRRCKHIVLVGILQTPVAATVAMLKAAGRMDVEDGLSEVDVRAGHQREAGHNILQAVGRIAVRYLISDQCPDGLTAWMIFSTGGQMSIPVEMVQHCFPGATIREWEPFGFEARNSRRKTDNRERFADALAKRLGDAQTVSFEARDLSPEFSPAMAFRFLAKDEDVKRILRGKHGLALERGERFKRGRARVDTYVVRRDG